MDLRVIITLSLIVIVFISGCVQEETSVDITQTTSTVIRSKPSTTVPIKHLREEKNYKNGIYTYPPIPNLNCSNPKNFNITQISFSIDYMCERGDLILVRPDNEKECKAEGGNYIPLVHYKSYPSLNEYHFYSIGLDMENIGCTKIDTTKLIADFYLYHDGKLVKQQIHSGIGNFDYYNPLYPEDVAYSALVTFVDPPLILNESGNYTFEIYLGYEPTNQLIGEDTLNFEIK